MANLYAQSTKITNASGRSNYLTDPLRQEEIVLHKVSMTYDWQFYSEYEKNKSQLGQSNNEAREIIIALPNELASDREKLKEICDDFALEILEGNHDFEYAVHWNHSRTNLHVHLLYSEREVNQEAKPKRYKKDIWVERDTNKLAKAHSENAVLRYKKGDLQKDSLGQVKLDGDPLSKKDIRFKAKSFNFERDIIIQRVFHNHGFSFDIQTKQTPFLSQKKRTKGASQDYLEKVVEWNKAVKDYNQQVKKHITIEPTLEMTYVSVRQELEKATQEENKKEKRISVQAINLVKDMSTWIKDQIHQFKIKTTAFLTNFELEKKWDAAKQTLSHLFEEKNQLELSTEGYKQQSKSLNIFLEENLTLLENKDLLLAKLTSEKRKQEQQPSQSMSLKERVERAKQTSQSISTERKQRRGHSR